MKIEAIHKEDGKITQYKLSNGKTVDKETCIGLVEQGKIENCHVGKSKTGEAFVATDRDKEGEDNITNLDNLPTF